MILQTIEIARDQWLNAKEGSDKRTTCANNTRVESQTSAGKVGNFLTSDRVHEDVAKWSRESCLSSSHPRSSCKFDIRSTIDHDELCKKNATTLEFNYREVWRLKTLLFELPTYLASIRKNTSWIFHFFPSTFNTENLQNLKVAWLEEFLHNFDDLASVFLIWTFAWLEVREGEGKMWICFVSHNQIKVKTEMLSIVDLSSFSWIFN